VHAGESSAPEGVRDAIELPGADRIDHGGRAVEDPALVAMPAERQVPLGICPTSNLRLGGYSAIGLHPVLRDIAATLIEASFADADVQRCMQQALAAW